MNSAFTRRSLTYIALVSCACIGLRSARAADAAIQYNRDVRPILFENCFSCHGPDSASRQAELRLDKREAAVDKKAIVPGNADASEMIRRILSEDADEQMPPPVTKKKLTDAQKELLVEWIKKGAEYQPHWSLIAPVRPPVPVVAASARRTYMDSQSDR
jgi:mono/diheme cytochrome c family protein